MTFLSNKKLLKLSPNVYLFKSFHFAVKVGFTYATENL